MVLILILGMLGLLALIGVTFATFSGQAQVGARYAAQAVDLLPPEEIFDFGLSQLINDTNNPASAMRGHSLKRDMYGRDFFTDPFDSTIKPIQNLYLGAIPAPLAQPLYVTNAVQVTGSTTGKVAFDVTTNIPTNNNTSIQQVPQLYGANFSGCVLRLQQWVCNNDANLTPIRQVVNPERMTQTFEVVQDNPSGQFHVLRLTLADRSTTNVVPDATAPYEIATGNLSFVQPDSTLHPSVTLAGGQTWINRFEIDGRYMRAFNGTGLNHPALVTVDNYGFNRPYAAFPNFLYNTLNSSSFPSGYNDPNVFTYQVDEDYDAADNENWFLALKNADGSVMIPSFYRPGNIVYNPNVAAQSDWQLLPNTAANQRANLARHSKFLRPRKADHPQSGDTFRDLIPDPATGKVTYDVDNDGDGVTDSVWLDLGFPVQRDPSGKLFKPLFSFMVLGLNGRLPLNTAGNLHKRNPDGTLPAVPEHASHVGYSVNEINPSYALTPTDVVFNEPYLTNTALPTTRFSSGPGDGKFNLQLLLQGNPGRPAPPLGVTPVAATAGRFGEVELMVASGGTLFPRAGRSYAPLDYTARYDFFDSDFNGLDFYSKDATGAFINPETRGAGVATADFLDLTNRVLLPSERMRRFVTPVDISGNGRIMPFDTLPYVTGTGTWHDFGLGFDASGRAGYHLYYRPPGVSDWASDGVVATDVSTNTVNVLHGYEAYRNPTGANRLVMAMMPWDAATVDPMNGLKIPTFGANINANPQAQNAGLLPSLAVDDAAQMNLYEVTPYDASFGPADQEWLNRKGDVDDSGLISRLSTVVEPKNLQDFVANATQKTVYDTYLNPFTTDVKAAEKRALFSVGSWEIDRWAGPVATLDPTFGTVGSVPGFGLPSYNFGQAFDGVATQPSLMQGNRRINLNLPLPVSTDPDEPVRQKWCRETYQMMKSVLYPSGATAEQLAALGQYVVNIIDFRDPDGTMTKFLNYDLVLSAPLTSTEVPAAPSPTPNPPPQAGAVPLLRQPAGVQLATIFPNTTPVEQWGMEYNPIAINEVLGFQYTRRDSANNVNAATPRLFVGLVNTLTKDNYTTGTGTASDLDLKGWGFIITQDDPAATDITSTVVERPNMVTGQLSQATIDTYFVPLAGTGMGTVAVPAALTNKVAAMDSAGTSIKPYVMANAPPPAADNAQAGAPNPDAIIAKDLMDQIPITKKTTMPQVTESQYYWIHLLRPANLYETDPAKIRRVVVDSFRFPFFVDDGKPVMNSPNNGDEGVVAANEGQFPIYSVHRRQPYRGGHYVPRSDFFSTPNPYGLTEQTRPARDGDSSMRGRYMQLINGTRNNTTDKDITAKISHTLDKDVDKPWDHFVFHDRDFQSVAELLLVPACPPGLFTKQFAEFPDLTPFGVATNTIGTQSMLPPYNKDTLFAAYDYSASPPVKITPPLTSYYYNPPFEKTPYIGVAGDPFRVNEKDLGKALPSVPDYAFNGWGVRPLSNPCAFPYLAEAFYYSLGSKAGWYKALEFFEVPSTALGYIGPVAAGQNADWAKRDLRPGLLNLNLIVDEEVFCGLIDDPRLNTAPVTTTFDPALPDPAFPALNIPQNLPPPGQATSYFVGVVGRPRYATAVYPNGMPSFSVQMGERGYPLLNTTVMKAAFADFLKLRDGGSGLVFSPFSTSPYATIWVDPVEANRIALPSRPFRSLANLSAGAGLDINDTVLRPARLPSFQVYNTHTDQGTRIDTVTHPGAWIPPRRLFEIPHIDPRTPFRYGNTMTYPGPEYDPSPAVEDNPALVRDVNNPNTRDPMWTPLDHKFLTNTNASLFVNDDLNTASPTFINGHLGAKTATAADPARVPLDPDATTPYPRVDHRSHPNFRTEILSKVMNQTTVRTHQYAVWMTVGFFEVVKPGNPQILNQYDPATGLSLAVDQLGKEIGADTGRNVRYRSYYLIDRTKATGFDPFQPGDFRDLITFRRRIE